MTQGSQFNVRHCLKYLVDRGTVSGVTALTLFSLIQPIKISNTFIFYLPLLFTTRVLTLRLTLTLTLT